MGQQNLTLLVNDAVTSEAITKKQEKTCKQYNFYSLDRASAVVSLNDAYDEEPEPNFDEEADDED